MPCRSCNTTEVGARLLILTDDDTWLTQEQVRLICEPCYQNMLKNNFSKIKKSVLEKVWSSNSMQFYEIVYKGKSGSKVNLGQFTLEPESPLYLEKTELPVPLNDLKKLPEIQVSLVELAAKPSTVEIKIIAAKAKGLKGIVWVGASPKRVNEFGTFVKDIPNFDVSPEAVEKLKALSSSFKVV